MSTPILLLPDKLSSVCVWCLVSVNTLQFVCKAGCNCKLIWLLTAAAHGFYLFSSLKETVFCGVLAVCLFYFILLVALEEFLTTVGFPIF